MSFESRRWSERPEGIVDSVDNPEPSASNLRVSDAERDAVIAQLGRHAADGRITLDEFEDRVEEALQARTSSDLREVLRDLPRSSLARRPARSAFGRSLRPVNPVLVGVALVVAISLAIGHVLVWPFFVFLGFCMFGGCHLGQVDEQVGRYRRPLEDRRDDRAITTV